MKTGAVTNWRTRLTAIASTEKHALIAIAVAIAGAIAVFHIGAYVAGETPVQFDVHIITSLRNPADLSDPIGPEWFEEAMRDLTSLGGTTILLIVALAAFAFLMMTDKRHAAWMLAASVLGAIVLSQTLKLGFGRPRPDLVPHAARVYTQSFPSGHAMMSAAVYLTLAALLVRTQSRRRVKLFILFMACLVTLLVGASRVYLGVHWPTDVLAGWVGGAAWAIFCWAVMVALQRRGRVEPPGNGEAPGA